MPSQKKSVHNGRAKTSIELGPADAFDESRNSLPFAELDGIVRPGASENESGTAGTRTQNQRIMSPLL